MIHMRSCKKNWERSVQPFQRLSITNKQRPRQATVIFKKVINSYEIVNGAVFCSISSVINLSNR